MELHAKASDVFVVPAGVAHKTYNTSSGAQMWNSLGDFRPLDFAMMGVVFQEPWRLGLSNWC